jgi:GYF domain 2
MSSGMANPPTAGVDGWFLLHDGEQHGPFPLSSFIKAVEEGTITKDHLIWRPGWEGWRSGSAAAELLAGQSSSAQAETAQADVTGPAVTLELPPPAPEAQPTNIEAQPTSIEVPPLAAAQEDPVVPEFAEVGPTELEQTEETKIPELSGPDPDDMGWVGSLQFLNEGVPAEPLEPLLDFSSEHEVATGPSPWQRHWTNVALAIVAISFSAFALRAALQNSGAHGGLVVGGAWAVFSVSVLAIIVWQLAGAWRSTSQQEERADSAFFTRAAQALVVVGGSAAVVIGAADSSLFGGSESLAAGAATEQVRGALIKAPVYATLQRLNPTAFDSITEQVVADFQPDASEDVILVKARPGLGEAIKQYTPLASEEAILDMTDVMVAYMKALQASDPESCVALNDLSTGARLRANLAKQFPDIFNRELAVDQRILATADVAHPIPTEPQIQRQLNTVQAQMTQRFDQGVGLLAKRDLTPSEYPTYCRIALALLQEIRRLPRGQAADLLRYVYAQS